MNYKEYFLLTERKSFINLATLTDKIINGLQMQIDKRGNGVRAGQKFTVPLGANYDLDIKFYKSYSNAARGAQDSEGNAHIGPDNQVHAMYFPETGESNGRIEVYINPSKKENRYYKDKSFEDFVNKSLPKYIKGLLTHEITHAYEDIVRDISRQRPDQGKGTNTEDDGEAYFNSDSEINAHLMEYVPNLLKTNANIQHYISKGYTKGIIREIFAKLAPMDWIKSLNVENKKWVMKTVYTMVAEYIKQQKDRQAKQAGVRSGNQPHQPLTTPQGALP
jgi:hypothetical protein